MNIPLARPSIGDAEYREMEKPLQSGWLVQGPQVARFEQAFAGYTGASHAVAVSSCTGALHIALTALGVKAGDEVIVPGFTWIATANAVEYLGATPVFCDIDLRTFNMDPSAIQRLITPRTVGIIPVHQFGAAADMDAILEIADRHNLWIVEDAACAVGTYYKGTHAGNFGAMGCFSFHPRKTVTTGEGGMIVTKSPELFELANSMRNHGVIRSSHDRFIASEKYRMADHPTIGYNYRLSDIHASMGIIQMQRLPDMMQRRKECAHRYDQLIASLPWLRFPSALPDTDHGYQSYVCLFADEEPMLQNVASVSARRNAVMATLESQGIATSQGTHAPFLQSYYVKKYGYTPQHCPRAYLAEQLSLALPFYVDMTAEDQESVTMALANAYANFA